MFENQYAEDLQNGGSFIYTFLILGFRNRL